jgi:DNA/RNA-binding domain of Phe-tRNA-synthetase-like protein
MKYTVFPWVFEVNPKVRFGIVVGRGLQNGPTTGEDEKMLSAAEEGLREHLNHADGAALKEHPDIAVYRDALLRAGINPNKFTNSVEGMSKRIVKGQPLPRINAMVDLCNVIALRHVVSLGGHDLADIDADLEVRRTVEGDRFLPFGAEEFESVPAGELVFTSGHKIQTRQWLWRQSELGKMTADTTDVFFQLVGFAGGHFPKLEAAMKDLETLIESRFGGSYTSFLVEPDRPSIEF